MIKITAGGIRVYSRMTELAKTEIDRFDFETI